MRAKHLTLSLVLLLSTISSAMAATGRIEGRVTLEHGRPLPGAQVVIDAISASAYTDSDGRYSLREIAAGSYELSFHWRDKQ